MRRIKELINRLYERFENRLSMCRTCGENWTIFKSVQCGHCQWLMSMRPKDCREIAESAMTTGPEPEKPTHFVFTCADGTAFKLPTDHPELNGGGIGGFAYEYICEDSSRMPYHFKQFAIADERNRPCIKDHRNN